MFKQRYLVTVGVLVILAITTFTFFSKNKTATTTLPSRKPSITQFPPTSEPSAKPTTQPTPTMATKNQPVNQTTTTSGLVTGNIICNFLIPSAPNHFGTVELDLSWNNLVYGQDGYKADLCLSTNGGATQSLITSKTTQNGKETQTIDWIAPDSNYIFTLFDQHGGDLPECAGIFLSSCQINSK